ncbi:MAG: response regulator [Nitrospirae bacterium]|nr:response regulator [Nitrospirota bacterium]
MAHKLFLADDSITIQKVVELILAEEGFDIKTANTGEEALTAIPTYMPDIILADIEMPKINGYQLCEKIKENPITSNIPVILLAGAFEPINEEMVKQVRADDFIVKPFESQELINKINSALSLKAIEGERKFEELKEEGKEELAEVIHEDDLWSFEQISEETEAKVLATESEETEEAISEAYLEVAEEIPLEVPSIEEEIKTQEIESAKVVSGIPAAEIPTKDELIKIFKDSVHERIDELISSVNLKELINTSLMPVLRDSVEKILWEVAPDLVERMLKEMLKGSLESLTKEVEKVIWETVPDLAETLISKEIERIRSEF